MLKVSLFGTPRITLNDEPIKIGRRKALALFCYLITRTKPVSRDTLATLLWSDYDAERARGDLRVSLWAINKAIGDDWLIVDRDTIQINPDKPFALDIQTFREAIQATLTHQHAPDELCVGCLPHYEVAHALYADDFLAGFTVQNSPEFEDWQLMEAESLRLSYQQVLQRLVWGNSALQQVDVGMQYAQRWLALDPFNEEAHRGIMALQAWSGNKTGALQQYHACEQILLDELDIPPSEETHQLYQDIKAGILPDVPFIYYDDVTPTIPHNLPLQSNPFRGRGQELAQLTGNLKNDDCRLLTITGLGGAGKTRLSIYTARQMLSHFEDGVFFISLGGASSLFAMLTDIADAIGFQFVSKEAQDAQLLTYLAPKKMLLVLDNFEHLIQHVSLVEQILTHAPHIKLMVTSRIPLNLKAEWIFTLDSMTEGAEQLFIDSAMRVERHFSATQPDVIQQICEHLVGMPLAIELAATWVRVLSVPEILEEIQHNKEALETDWQDIPERQRSLQETFNYSWELLNDVNRLALMRLAIFPTSFNHQAAKQIANVRITSLSTLAAQTLIKRNAQGRYELHALIRQFALEKLRQNSADYTQTTLAFIRYFNQFLADHQAELKSEQMLNAKASLLMEIDSIRAACALALEHHKADLMLDGLNALATLYEYQAWYEEGRALFEQFTHAIPQHNLLTLRSKIYWGKFCYVLGDSTTAKNLLTQAINHAQPYPDDMARGYVQLCYVNFQQHPDLALEYAQKALEVYEEINQPLSKGTALRALAEIKVNKGLIEEGYHHAQEALKTLLPLGKTIEIPPIYQLFCSLNVRMGNYEDALTNGKLAVDLYKTFDLKDKLIRAQNTLASVQDRYGQYEEAKINLEAAIELAEHFQFQESLVYSLTEYGSNAYFRKDYQTAITTLERAAALSQKLHMQAFSHTLKINIANVLIELADYARAESLLTSIIPEFEALGNAYMLLIAECTLGKNHTFTQQYDKAHQALQHAIQLAHDNQLTVDWLTAICYMGELYYAQERHEDALQLIEFVLQHESTESSIREEAADYRQKITLALGKEQVKHLLKQSVDIDTLLF